VKILYVCYQDIQASKFHYRKFIENTDISY